MKDAAFIDLGETVIDTSGELTRKEIDEGLPGCFLLAGLILAFCAFLGLVGAALLVPATAVIKWVFS